MNLPNYFLADLAPDAPLTVAMITEATATLKRNRQSYLAQRSTQGMIELLSYVGGKWLEPDFLFRKLALEAGPEATGFSRGTLAAGLDGFFRELTLENLQALLEQDLGCPERLEQMAANAPGQQAGRVSLVTAPEFLVQITAGNLPNPTLLSMALGLLMRSAQFIKAASGASLLPRLFAHSLYDADRKVGACLEIAEWRGGNVPLETALAAAADCITISGSDEAVDAIRRLAPIGIPVIAYGERLSFAYVSAASLSQGNGPRVARQAAVDVSAWNQLGCLSPHVVYVESGGQVSPEQFAAMLAEELARVEVTEPRGPLPVAAAAGIASRRSFYEVRAAHSAGTQLWCSKDSTAWTVVFEADPQFQISCLYRFIYVKSVANLTQALHAADSVRGKVSTVALAVPKQEAAALALELGRWGVTRICPLGQMQQPPLSWRHDGRPPLGELVRWTDWEQG